MSNADETPATADISATRSRGLRKMKEVYGFDYENKPSDHFRYTADHLFAEIWNRPGLENRDRRLMLVGMLV